MPDARVGLLYVQRTRLGPAAAPGGSAVGIVWDSYGGRGGEPHWHGMTWHPAKARVRATYGEAEPLPAAADPNSKDKTRPLWMGGWIMDHGWIMDGWTGPRSLAVDLGWPPTTGACILFAHCDSDDNDGRASYHGSRGSSGTHTNQPCKVRGLSSRAYNVHASHHHRRPRPLAPPR